MGKLLIIANAFSLKMIERKLHEIIIEPISVKSIKTMLNAQPWISIVGHESTAKLFSKILGVPVPYNRCTLEWKFPDKLIVGLLNGDRLPEGKFLSDDDLVDIEVDWRLIKWA